MFLKLFLIHNVALFPIGKLAGCLLNILMIHHEFPDKYHPKVSGGFSMATC